MTSPLRLVVFDVDGTLVDSQADIVAGMTHAFGLLGREAPTRDAILQTVGLSLPQCVQRLAPDASAEEQRALVEAYKTTYRDLRIGAGSKTSSPLYPGIADLLDRLAGIDPLLLGVATGKSRRGLDVLLDAHDIRRCFVTTQCADDHPSKPHPSMLLTTLSETGIEPENAVVIGDTSYDIAMGQAAAMRTIAVSWGYHDRQSLSAADSVVDSVTDLTQNLLDWMEINQ